MSEIVLLTDNSADLPEKTYKELGVERVSLGHQFPHAQPKDDSIDAFYATLSPENMPKTSAINPDAFIEKVEPILTSGRKVVYFGLTEGLSSTFSNSRVAQIELSDRYPDGFFTVETRCVSGGLGMLVTDIARLFNSGKLQTPESIIEYVNANSSNIIEYFVLNDLKYLAAGGRIPPLLSIAGNLIQIKPALYIAENGTIQLAKKIIGFKSACKAIVEALERTIILDENSEITICCGANLDDAHYCAQLIRSYPHLRYTKILFGPDYRVGKVIGSHTGPGVIAIFAHGTSRKPIFKNV